MKNLKIALLAFVMINLPSQFFAAQPVTDDAPQIEQNRQALRRPQHQQIEDLASEWQQTKSSLNETAAHSRTAVGNLDPSFAANLAEGGSAVYSLATQPDGKFLVGGSFSAVNGERRGSLERFNADGSRDTSFNAGGAGINGAVYVINVLPTGKILISGSFTNYNNQTALSLARLNADGTLDTTFTVQGTSVNSIQDTIVQPDGKILISGSFTLFNGVTRNRVARLNADGTLDTTFNPNVNDFTEELVLQPDGKIIIGGLFTEVGGVPLNGIARLNPDGSVDPSFNVGSGVSGEQPAVFAAERQADGKILIGGNFTAYNGTPRSNVARLNIDGTLDTSFNSNTGGFGAEFFAIQPDGKILVAGAFTASNFAVVRLNNDGSFDSSFTPASVNDYGYVVALRPDGSILLGGLFSQYGSLERRKFVHLNPDGTPYGADSSFTSDPIVRAIVQQPDGKILVGGQFRQANGLPRPNIARFNQDGTLDPSFNAANNFGGFNSPSVWSIAVQPDGKILVGGLFSFFYGNQSNYVARLNPDGSLDTSFLYPDATNTVREIEVQPDGKILLGGFFQNDAQQIFSGLVRLNNNGSYDQTFVGTGASSSVNQIKLLPDGKALIGGFFTFYNGVSRRRIARINSDGSLDLTFDPGTGANSTVYDLVTLPNGQIYVGGFFSSFNDLPNTNNIVRLNANGTVDTTFSTSPTSISGGVYALSLEPDGKLLAGGNFVSYNGVRFNPKLALFNSDGSPDNDFVSPFNNIPANFVYRLTKQSDGKTLVGGFFDLPRPALFRLNAGNSVRRTLFDFDGDGRADISVFRPATGTWYVQRSQAGFISASWGSSGDKLAPADYDGDGKTDFAVFRNGTWYIINSFNSAITTLQFGAGEDLPRPADFDGDNKADISVFRPSNGFWYRLNSSNNSFVAVNFGATGDTPQPADFDGDGRADINIFRASNGSWYRLNSSNNQLVSTTFGGGGDLPTAADFDGDGKADISVFRPATGSWYRLNSSDGQFSAAQFGATGDVPAAADYDGDNKTDLAVFRNGSWYLQQTTGGFAAITFGTNGDAVIPAIYTQ